MQHAGLRKVNVPAAIELNRFSAFKARLTRNQEKDGFVHGLNLIDLEDQRRFPMGTQHDEQGDFVWGVGINEGQKV